MLVLVRQFQDITLRLVMLVWDQPMLVNGEASFVGFVTTKDVFISGGTTALGQYHLENLSSGVIRATSIGIDTNNPLQSFQIGDAPASGISVDHQIFTVSGIGSVGVGTTVQDLIWMLLDIQDLRLSRVMLIMLNQVLMLLQLICHPQNFICTASADIDHFVLNNAPPGSSEFTLKIDQDSDGNHYAVVDHFQTGAGTSIPVYWLVVEFFQVSQPRQVDLTSLHTGHLMVKILLLLVYTQSSSVKTLQTEVN